MISVEQVVVAQPDGLTLALTFRGPELRVLLSGTGLTAEASAKLDPAALLRVLDDTIGRVPPPKGCWEYKPSDDAIELHARPDGAGGMLLDVGLVMDSPFVAAWRVEGTLALSDQEWVRVRREVAGACSPDAEQGAAPDPAPGVATLGPKTAS